MRVAGGSGGGGGISYPPSGNLQIYTGGPNSASALKAGVAAASYNFNGAADDSGKTLLLYGLSAAPYLKGELFDHASGQRTALSLSGFGTFSSTPGFHIAGYDIENGDYWANFNINGGSGSITVDTLYPMTLSGNTLTLGTGVTPPAIAGKSVNPFGCCVNNGKIVQTYNDNLNFRIDTARVYDISLTSWATPAGGTVSPYAATLNATLDSNVPDEVAFSAGAQNNKGYISCNHANNSPVFVEFEFTAETFVDRSGIVPVTQDLTATTRWSMALDPSGNYGVGFFRNSTNSESTVFVYDTSNDSLISFYPLEINSDKYAIAGDESNGNLGFLFTEINSSNYGFRIPYVNEASPSSGTFAGVEAIGLGTNSDYGASDCALLINIDANGWQTYPRVQSLWSQEGYKKFLQAYADSIEIIFIPAYSSGEFDLITAPSIYYTN